MSESLFYLIPKLLLDYAIEVTLLIGAISVAVNKNTDTWFDGVRNMRCSEFECCFGRVKREVIDPPNVIPEVSK